VNSACVQETIRIDALWADGGVSGSAVAQYPSAANPRVLQHSIELGVTVNSVPLSDACRERYRLALAADLLDLSRLINELICNGSMCPYMSGAPGTGVRVNESAIINKHVVFVAIDTASLSNAVTLDVVGSTVGRELLLVNISQLLFLQYTMLASWVVSIVTAVTTATFGGSNKIYSEKSKALPSSLIGVCRARLTSVVGDFVNETSISVSALRHADLCLSDFGLSIG